MPTAAEIIKILGLKPHPNEGGFFRETYRSTESTAIYYLLTPETLSAMHKLPGDEMFHFYRGDPVEMLQLHPDGTGTIHVLGTDLKNGMQQQVLVAGGTWQGSSLLPGGAFALLGTTMAPPFEYQNYESGNCDELIKQYPKFSVKISSLTR